MLLADNNLGMLSTSNIRLETHQIAREKACTTVALSAGTTVLVVDALVVALSTDEKGQRCDFCLHAPREGARLSKCSGGKVSYPAGQKIQWQEHHRRLCRKINNFMASAEYQVLSEMERVDSVLLSQLAAIVISDDGSANLAELSGPMSIFFDLLKGPAAARKSLPVCALTRSAQPPAGMVENIYTRFGNNNFLIHSHLTSCAHGVFPLASRLFNHSCSPSCVAKYVFTPAKPVRMEVVAIQDLAVGQEITLPYLDPALPLTTRQDALRINYGFHCICPLCTYQQRISPLPPLPQDTSALLTLQLKLHEVAAPFMSSLAAHGQAFDTDAESARFSLSTELHALLNADYLPYLSEEFSRTSHEGEADTALTSGHTLLALYLAIYPPQYPQIGMHALELAKTAWNALITNEQTHDTSSPHVDVPRILDAARRYLNIASNVLQTFGPEGDGGGPLEELIIMRSLLHEYQGEQVTAR